MSNIPLMAKYRPRTLGDMVGQDDVKILQHDIATDSIKPLYIMYGTFGTGKTTAARAFARDYNCSNRRDGEVAACGVCHSCQEADAGSARYLTEINATENSSVDSIRELLASLRIGGFGRRRFIILDEAHHMSPQAMDTLLKTCEAPDNDFTFIMVTSEKQRIRQGLISRASMIRMRPIDVDIIEDRLRYICSEEGLDVSEADIRACAQRANGSMRTAINNVERAAVSGLGAEDTDGDWDAYIDALAGDDPTSVLVALAKLLDGDYTPLDVLSRSFMSVRDAVVAGDERWGVGLSRYALSELARAVQVMNSSGADRIVLEAAVVSIVSPPHRDVELQVSNAVERALSKVDFSGVVRVVSPPDSHAVSASPGLKNEEGVSPGAGGSSPSEGHSDGARGKISAVDTEDSAKESEGDVPVNDVWDDSAKGTTVWDGVDADEPADRDALEAAREQLRESRKTLGDGEDVDEETAEEAARGFASIYEFKRRMKNGDLKGAKQRIDEEVAVYGADKVAEALVEDSGLKDDEPYEEEYGLPDDPDDLLDVLREVKEYAEEDGREDVLDVFGAVGDWEIDYKADEVILILFDDVVAAPVTRRYIAEEVGCSRVSVKYELE